MQVSVDKISDLERKMTVQVPAEDVDSQVEERLKSMMPRTKVHGFRPGKVPMRVVRQMYGKQVREEVLGELIQSSFVETVQKEQLRPTGGPRVERSQDAPGEAFEYSATFEVYPEIELAPLEELEVKRVSAEINDADVDRVVENMRHQRTRWEPAERPAEDGDRVALSFEGRIDGETFPGGSTDDYPLILGSGQMIPGFESGLTGTSDPNQELAGKAVQFAVEIKGVSAPILPDLDDTFFTSFGVEEGGKDEFLDAVKQNMMRELEQATRGRVKGDLFDRLVEANPVAVPQGLVEEEIDRMIEQMQERTGVKAKSGLPRDLFTEQAQRRVALSLLVGELVKASELEPDAERVRQMVESHASGYENPEEVINWFYSSREQLSSVEMAVLEDQVVDWVLERTKVVDEQIPFDEMMKQPGSAPVEEASA